MTIRYMFLPIGRLWIVFDNWRTFKFVKDGESTYKWELYMYFVRLSWSRAKKGR